MSKRFGRNQKRRLNTQIAMLERKLVMAGDGKRFFRSALNDANNQLQRVADTLGENFVGIRAQCVKNHPDTDRYPALVGCDTATISTFDSRLIDEVLHTVHLDLMKPSVCYTRGMIHFRIEHRETGFQAYAISKKTLMSMPKKTAADMMAVEMSRLLVSEIHNAQGGIRHDRY